MKPGRLRQIKEEARAKQQAGQRITPADSKKPLYRGTGKPAQKRSRIIRYEQVSPRGNAEIDTSRLMFAMDGRMFLMGVDDVFTACTPEQVAAIDKHFGDDLRVLFFGALERLADTD